MKLSEAKRLLLLEFINAEMFPGQICDVFPLLMGYAAHFGKKAHWIRFGMSTAHFYKHGRDTVTLNDEELAAVSSAFERIDPDLVVGTHLIAPHLLDAMGGGQANVPYLPVMEAILAQDWSFASAGLLNQQDSPLFLYMYELGRPGFRPEYRWEPGNPEALRADRNNVYLIQSRGCGYRRQVSENPLFSDVGLPELMLPGCSFCGGRVLPVRDDDGSGDSPPNEFLVSAPPTPEDWIPLQIKAIADSLGPDRLPNALILPDIERPEILASAFKTMLAIGSMSQVRLLAGLRVDRLLQLEETLWDALARSDDAPSLHVFSCGLENFSKPELDRMNKGTSPVMNARAVNLLKELELGLSGHFYYSGYMALSVLFFTPWTTISDLHLNVRLLQHLELENEVGNLFMSRLRLHPDLAITFLARHSGVTVEDEEDEALKLNRRKLFPEEIPWRHLEPRLRPLSRIAVRMESDDDLSGDPLYEAVQEAFLSIEETHRSGFRRGGRRRVLVEALVSLIEATANDEAVLDESELIARTRQVIDARRSRSLASSFRLGEAALNASEYLRRVVSLVTSGSRPAISIDGVAPSDADSFEMAALESVGLETMVLDEPGNAGGASAQRILVARDAAILQALADAHKALWSATERDAASAAAERIGTLFGYPPCCVRACSSRARPHVSRPNWSIFAGKAELDGPVSPIANPLLLGGVGFVPCRADCDAASKVFAEWRRALGLPEFPGADRAFVFALSDGPDGELVGIDVSSTGAESLDYAPGSVAPGLGPLRAKLVEGNRLVFRPGQVQVLRDERLVALWTASVGVWSPTRGWHGSMWRELERAALRNGDPWAHEGARLMARIAPRIIADPDILGDRAVLTNEG